MTPQLNVSGLTPTLTFEKDVRVVFVHLKANHDIGSYDVDTGEEYHGSYGQAIITNVSGANVTIYNAHGNLGYVADVYAYA